MGSRSSLAVCSGSGRSLRRNAQADAKADASSGPSRGEAAARCGFIRNRKFNIQNSRFKINWMPSTLGCLCQFGLQPAEGSHEADLRDASCGPPLPGGCGPPIAARLIRCKKPATGRRASAAPGCSPPTSCEVDFACGPLGPGGPASRTARRLLKRPATTRPTTRKPLPAKSPCPPKALARQKPLPAKSPCPPKAFARQKRNKSGPRKPGAALFMHRIAAYSAIRISSILMAETAIFVPGPKMAAAPSR